jgi:hypothetical protein
MLAQFQSLYPNGCIISELVQIFQGKYIVRVSLQIEGITRITAMAGAETIEVAEDQARERALIVLGMVKAPEKIETISPQPIFPEQQNPPLSTASNLQESTDTVDSQGSWSENQEIFTNTAIEPDRDLVFQEDVIQSNDTSDRSPKNYDSALYQSYSTTTDQETQSDALFGNTDRFSSNQSAEDTHALGNTISNVTPFIPRNSHIQEETGINSGRQNRKKKQEPVNLSDVIAKTDVEIERLCWTKEQGREHLKKTYGKLGRSLLSETELLDFLQYLESQPDPLAGF